MPKRLRKKVNSENESKAQKIPRKHPAMMSQG